MTHGTTATPRRGLIYTADVLSQLSHVVDSRRERKVSCAFLATAVSWFGLGFNTQSFSPVPSA